MPEVECGIILNVKPKTYGATTASVDTGGKVNLPRNAVERLSWRSDTSPTECWLYVIQPGRYRLLSEEDLKRSEAISQILERVTSLEEPDQGQDPADAEGSTSAAAGALLVPASLSFNKKSGWRLAISKHTYAMRAMISQRRVIIMFSEGYLEIWTPDTLDRVLEQASAQV
jgi:hypothetical protein